MNIKTKLVVKRIAAVEKLAGKIRRHIIKTGITTGRNADLKSLITSCLFVSIRAKYIMSVSLARSEVWKVSPKGSGSTLLASFRFIPKKSVNRSNGTAI